MRQKSPRIAVRAVLIHDNKLLLVNAWPDGKSKLLCAPGGGVEPGSALPDNLMREVYEETASILRFNRQRLDHYQHPWLAIPHI